METLCRGYSHTWLHIYIYLWLSVDMCVCVCCVCVCACVCLCVNCLYVYAYVSVCTCVCVSRYTLYFLGGCAIYFCDVYALFTCTGIQNRSPHSGSEYYCHPTLCIYLVVFTHMASYLPIDCVCVCACVRSISTDA